MHFKKDDKVLFGKYRGIVRVVDSYNVYAVEFAEDFRGGHNCSGLITSSNGWWCGESELKLIEPAVVKTNQELIIDKIKYLDKKFKDRNKNEYPF